MNKSYEELNIKSFFALPKNDLELKISEISQDLTLDWKFDLEEDLRKIFFVK